MRRRTYELRREQWLPGSLEEVFAFFSRPQNLERITPRWLRFRFAGTPPASTQQDLRIVYAMRIVGIPVRWQTWIARWEPPHAFMDVQERGPYARWEHLHSFRPCGEGVLMSDVVTYELPFGILGRVVHWLAVRAMLARIFDYRFEAVRELKSSSPPETDLREAQEP